MPNISKMLAVLMWRRGTHHPLSGKARRQLNPKKGGELSSHEGLCLCT
jgi:hypothetical protein